MENLESSEMLFKIFAAGSICTYKFDTTELLVKECLTTFNLNYKN